MDYLRVQLRHHPRLKAGLLPRYVRLLHWFWQLRNFLTGHRPIVFSAGEHMLKLHPDGSVPEVLYTGNFEAVERDFVATCLVPGMVVVDAGANVGLYTVISSALVGANGRVYAFEPGRLTFERLQRNLYLNQCQNVIATRVALSNTNSPMVLRVDAAHPTLDGHRFVRPMDEVIHPTATDEIVKCQTLDDCLRQQGVDRIHFMKVDVEGAELALLQGAELTLKRSTDITVILECTQNRQQVQNLLDRHGFQYFKWDCDEQILKPSTFDEAVVTGNVIVRRAVERIQ
ncbi:MAG: FkbM family methyltransferase [Caldilineaceae bacterium]|nr:FkbM family methyltransferase [Caldilineaceae bacterium]